MASNSKRGAAERVCRSATRSLCDPVRGPRVPNRRFGSEPGAIGRGCCSGSTGWISGSSPGRGAGGTSARSLVGAGRSAQERASRSLLLRSFRRYQSNRILSTASRVGSDKGVVLGSRSHRETISADSCIYPTAGGHMFAGASGLRQHSAPHRCRCRAARWPTKPCRTQTDARRIIGTRRTSWCGGSTAAPRPKDGQAA